MTVTKTPAEKLALQEILEVVLKVKTRSRGAQRPSPPLPPKKDLLVITSKAVGQLQRVGWFGKGVDLKLPFRMSFDRQVSLVTTGMWSDFEVGESQESIKRVGTS